MIMKMKNEKRKTKDMPRRGFTLLEMLVSIGIFSVLVVAAIDITLGISNAQLKTASLQAIQDNIRFGLELVTKEMRTGTDYNLSSFCAPAGSEISFTTSTGEQRIYYLDAVRKAIMRVRNSVNCANAIQFTAEEVSVDTLTIRLRGQTSGPNDGQPTATLSLKISSSDPRFGGETSMNLQTTVVQRFRDL